MGRRQPPEKPICKTTGQWLIGQLGKGCLAPLTGQDAAALHAFAHLLRLYSFADIGGRGAAIDAMAATTRAMQPQLHHLAKKLIPHALDWSDEEPLWDMIVMASARQTGRTDGWTVRR